MTALAPSADNNRKMFLSYVVHAVIGPDPYDRNPQPDGVPADPIKNMNGYFYVDNRQGLICVRGEHVYLEIEYEKLVQDLQEKP